MKYRADIDGLRAVAVVPVILFHAGFQIFSGGYVGVDVFFVISGYLITTIFINELADGKFSIVNFYERRVRRIMPALLFVILCTIPFAWMWMLPAELSAFSDSIIHTLFFISNVFFYDAQDYFAPAAELQPLLHTWSLAVEEQYYIFAPPLAAFFWRFGIAKFTLIAMATALASFILCLFFINTHPSFAFYMPFTRVWELQAGALCALLQFQKPQSGNSYLSLLGLALIVIPILMLDASTPFPSHYTLAPVLGVVLVILYGGEKTPASRILAFKPFVAIGLISYSAYLWHQPLFAFARIRSIKEPSQTLMAVLAGFALLLAYLSWRFVEQSFRRRPTPFLPDRRKLFGVFAAFVALVAGFGFFIIDRDGLEGRAIARENSEIESRLANHHKYYRVCESNDVDGTNFRTSCVHGNGKPRLMLYGDSYAMHLFEALKEGDADIPVIMKTKASCAPIVGMVKIDSKRGANWRQVCMDHNDYALKYIEENAHLEVVVMSSPFAAANSAMQMRDGSTVPKGNNLELLIEQILATVERFRKAGKRVVIVSPTPAPGGNIGDCVKKSVIYKFREDYCDFDKTKGIERRPGYKVISGIEDHVPVIRLEELLCSENVCDVFRNGTIMYRDEGHLSKEGSVLLGKEHGLKQLVFDIAN